MVKLLPFDTVNDYLEAFFTRIEGKIDGYQKDISQRLDKIEERLITLEGVKYNVVFQALDSIETLRQDELTSRPQTLAELEERIEKLESDQVAQDNRFGTGYESITDEIQKLVEELKQHRD